VVLPRPELLGILDFHRGIGTGEGRKPVCLVIRYDPEPVQLPRQGLHFQGWTTRTFGPSIEASLQGVHLMGCFGAALMARNSGSLVDSQESPSSLSRVRVPFGQIH
jgi:hypothetical protein